MKVTFLFFASVGDALGRSSVALDLPDNVSLLDGLIHLVHNLGGDLKAFLFEVALSLKGNLHLALNLRHVSSSDFRKLRLKDGDVVAIFPTPSGG